MFHCEKQGGERKILRVASISHYWKSHSGTALWTLQLLRREDQRDGPTGRGCEGGDRVILVKVELGRTSRKYLYKYGSGGQIVSDNLVILLFLF